ncbi:MAG: response regulator transcription factor [Cellulosilyticaceae bacterium]
MRILLIEDDTALCDAISFQLQSYEYTVDTCHDGEEGLLLIQNQIYDLIILDRMLPSLNGIDIVKAMRRLTIHIPVIMVTALNSIGDRVVGLDAGADDYLVKPFAIEELLARIRALSRRPTDWTNEQTLRAGNTTLDISNAKLIGPSSQCTLSKREASLFETFFKQYGQTLPRALLLTRVWGPDYDVEDGNLDNYIHFLRRRLRTIHSNLEVKTIRGVGYILEVTHA